MPESVTNDLDRFSYCIPKGLIKMCRFIKKKNFTYFKVF